MASSDKTSESPWADYLEKLDKRQKDAVLQTMEIAEREFPGAVRVMSYGVPTIKLNKKYIMAVGANKDFFSVYPFGWSAIEATKHLLHGLSYSKGTIRFPYDQLPSEEQIKAIVVYKTTH